MLTHGFWSLTADHPEQHRLTAVWPLKRGRRRRHRCTVHLGLCLGLRGPKENRISFQDKHSNNCINLKGLCKGLRNWKLFYLKTSQILLLISSMDIVFVIESYPLTRLKRNYSYTGTRYIKSLDQVTERLRRSHENGKTMWDHSSVVENSYFCKVWSNRMERTYLKL